MTYRVQGHSFKMGRGVGKHVISNNAIQRSLHYCTDQTELRLHELD